MRAALLTIVVLTLVGCARRAPPIQVAPPQPVVVVITESPSSPPPDPLGLPPPPGHPDADVYSKRLDFGEGGPVVAIRLMEGQREVTFSPRGQMRLRLPGQVEKTVEAPAGSVWRVRITDSTPAEVIPRIQLAELRFEDRAGLKTATREWKARGIKIRHQVQGALYGISGKVTDNRRHLVLLDEELDRPGALSRQAELLAQHGERTVLLEEPVGRPSGILELLDETGSVLALAQDRIEAETSDQTGFSVRQVEFGVGYDFHGFQDRIFRGALELVVDRHGTLAVINRVSLEDLLKGLVPSEIFSRAHPEALKAQAVTARGEVLAKIGSKHLSDPYLLCSEQHCAVYSGMSGETPMTNAAVEATYGEGLFNGEGRLVDSVYSAVCGGHTEDNDVVWGGARNPNLRGKPDVLPDTALIPSPGLEVEAFLNTELPSACRLSTFAQPTKYRWERRFSAAEVNALGESLGLGAIQAIAVAERGVSGRARVLSLSGLHRATQIRGELNIRKAFRMLNSALFVVTVERDPAGNPETWVFRGGGWGHGVGMCQTGAVGRAEAGQDYRAILRHYFNGAEATPIY